MSSQPHSADDDEVLTPQGPGVAMPMDVLKPGGPSQVFVTESPQETTPTPSNPLLEAALDYVEKGYMVFPCKSGEKKPATKHGLKDASDVPEVIKFLWSGCPDYNVGLRTGNGLMVLDIDPPGGEDSLAILEAKHRKLPETVEQKTPSGGRHLFYRYPKELDIRNSASGIAPGLDIRANGGYVVMAPSKNKEGQYILVKTGKVAEAPAWLLDLIQPAKEKKEKNHIASIPLRMNGTKGTEKVLAKLLAAEEGTRNDQLNKAAFALGPFVAAGKVSQDQATETLLKTALAIGLDKEEALATIASGLGAGISKPRSLEYLGARLPSDKAPHIQVADVVLNQVGEGNLITIPIGTYRWSDKGVWKLLDDRVLNREIIIAMPENDLTKSTKGSVLDIIKDLTFLESHEFDKNPQTINVRNGELTWSKEQGWEHLPHCREHYRTTQCPVDYDPGATAPRFEQFLGEVFQDDPDRTQKIAITLEALGYSLLATSKFEKFFLLIGGGANGKSVLMGLVAMLVGAENIAAVQPSQFDNKFQRAHLHGKLVNLVTEIPEGAMIDDASLKAIVSGEVTTAEHKFQKPFEFSPFATCWFGTNHRPHTRDFTDGFFRRAIVLEFNRTFTEDEQDKDLKTKLEAELSGILNLALRGIEGVLKSGKFTEAPSVQAAISAWRMDVDQVAQFVQEVCRRKDGHEERSCDIYKDYLDWAKLSGHHKAVTKITFTQRLVRLGAATKRGKTGERMIVGFALPRETGLQLGRRE